MGFKYKFFEFLEGGAKGKCPLGTCPFHLVFGGLVGGGSFTHMHDEGSK